jgi:hypothetical protein
VPWFWSFDNPSLEYRRHEILFYDFIVSRGGEISLEDFIQYLDLEIKRGDFSALRRAEAYWSNWQVGQFDSGPQTPRSDWKAS